MAIELDRRPLEKKPVLVNIFVFFINVFLDRVSAFLVFLFDFTDPS